MNPALLALFIRSLREDARGGRTYLARAVLSGIFLLLLFGESMSNGWNGAPGRDLLSAMFWLQIMAITFVGLSYFTSAIAEEKEEQTLGLLRMTDLSSLAILLGKSTSRLCSALLLLLAQFPFTIFAIMLGGVSLRQVAAMYCALAAYTFLLCNLALLGSVLARRTTGAAVFCLATMAALDVVGHFRPLVREAFPFTRLDEVIETGFDGSLIGWQGVSNLAFGLGCFFLAWALFGRFCDRAANTSSPSLFGLVRLFQRSRPPRVWKSAATWKDFYFLCGGRLGFALRMLGYGGVLLALRQHSVVWISFAFSLELALLASRIFRVELNDRTLAGLAALPCGIHEVARAKSRACYFVAAPGAIAALTAQLLTLLSTTGKGRWGLTFVISGVWVTLFVLVHIVAWLSLRMKRGAFPVGYGLTFVGSLFVFGFCGMITISPMLQSGFTWPVWWANAITILLPLIMFGGIALGPALLVRGAIPLELAELAGEE